MCALRGFCRACAFAGVVCLCADVLYFFCRTEACLVRFLAALNVSCACAFYAFVPVWDCVFVCVVCLCSVVYVFCLCVCVLVRACMF